MGWVKDNTNKDPMAKVGMRIRMLSMNDEEHPVDQGLEGTITHIDGLGTIHVRWDDGRSLGVIPGLDEYQILPPEDEQVGPDDFEGLFEDSDFKLSPAAKKISRTSKPIKKMKVGLNKLKKYDIKVESEEVPGGEAEGMTAKDLAEKHGVSVKDIEKEIEVGTKIEMEHTDSKKMAKEIAMDHIAEFPDYYTNKKYGVKASEKGLEKELEETTTTGALGASPIQPLGSPIRNKKAKETSSYVITKGDLKNPLGKVYSVKSESKVIKVKDLLNEITNTADIKSTSDFLINNLLGWADLKDMSPPWPSKNHLADNKQHEDWWWQKTPTYNDGVITDPYAKTNEVWDDEKLEVTIDQDLQQFRRDIDKNKKNYEKRITKVGKAFDVNVDTVGMRWANYSDNERNIVVKENVNEGWLRKTREDKIVLDILKRVKEEFPEDTKLEYHRKTEEIKFTLFDDVHISIKETYYYGDLRDSYSMLVNKRELQASRWAIKKLFKYMEKEINKRDRDRDTTNIEADLLDPNYAQNVFATLDDTEPMNEAKKDKDIHTAKWDRCFEKVSKEKGDEAAAGICTDSIGYEGSIKKSHRRKDKKEIEETTTFSSVFGNDFPVTPFMFAKKGKHIPSKKPIWKGGKIVQKADKADLLGEDVLKHFNKLNNVKWVKGGKFVKIKDKCAKYNNQPHCSQGAIDDPLELSDTVFENIKNISKKTGLSEKYILEKITNFLNEDTYHRLSWLDRLKIKLAGIDEDQVLYNLNNNLPVDWNGTKEGYYEKNEPKGNNNRGSN